VSRSLTSPAMPVLHPIRVTHEWARLREVVVGTPYYRIPQPFPARLKRRIGARTWQTIKAQEGERLADAFPQLHARMRGQIDHVVALLRRHGVTVHRVPRYRADEEPDRDSGGIGALQHFPRDPWLVAGGHIIELAMADVHRRRELLPLRRLLDRALDTRRPRRLSMPGVLATNRGPARAPRLEGGDCLVCGREIFVGLSGRSSNRAGVAWLRAALGPDWRVTPVPLRRDVPHLDMALGLVRPGLGIRCPRLLPAGVPKSLADWEWIEASPEEALQRLATNILPLDARTTLIVAEAPRVADALDGRGQEVIAVPFSWVAFLGGGLRCWSHPLIREY